MWPAGGGSGGQQLLDVGGGQAGEVLQLQSRNTQDISDGLELRCRVQDKHNNHEGALGFNNTQQNNNKKNTCSRLTSRTSVGI